MVAETLPDKHQVRPVFTAASCNGSLHCADWGENGLICYGSSKKLVFYDPERYNDCGEILCTVGGHEKVVNAVCWVRCIPKETSSSSNYLVSASGDGTGNLWSVKRSEDGTVVAKIAASLKGHEDSVNDVDCVRLKSPGDDAAFFLAATVSTDSTLRIWKKTVSSEEGFNCTQVEQFPKRGLGLAVRIGFVEAKSMPLIFCAKDDSKIQVFTLNEDGSFGLAQSLVGHQDWVRCMDLFSLDASNIFLASGSQDKAIRVWRISAEGPASIAPESNDDDVLKRKALTIVGCTLSSTPEPTTLTVSLETVLNGHENWVYGVRWGQTEDKQLMLLSASVDKTMVIWEEDPEAGLWLDSVRVGDIGGNQLGFFGCLVSPNCDRILGHTRHGAFQMWKKEADTSSWSPAVGFGGHFGKAEDIAWETSHGAYLLSTGADQTTRLFSPWNRPSSSEGDSQVVSWHEMGRPQVHGHDLSCVASVSSTCFVSGAEEKVVRAFRAPVDALENLATLSGNFQLMQELSEADLSALPVGASVPALGLSNKAVFESDIGVDGEGDEAANQKGDDDQKEAFFKHVSLNAPPTEDLLLQNCLWPEVYKMYAHPYEIFALAAAHDGRLVASACKASQPEHARIVLWETSTWQVKQWLPGHTLTITQLRFSPDDSSLLSVSRDRSWCLFRKGEDGSFSLVARLRNKPRPMHSRIIWACDWTPDSNYFITVSRDKSAIVWASPETVPSDSTEPQDGTLVSKLSLKESITSVAFAPTKSESESYLVAFGLETGEIVFYQWQPGGEWTHISTLGQDAAHCDVVRRLMFKPRAESDEDDVFLLASCSADRMVRIYSVDFRSSVR